MVGDSAYDLTPETVPVSPLIKTETANDGDNDIYATVRPAPWSLSELAKLQERYSRHPEESEYVCQVFLTREDSGMGLNPTKGERGRKLLGAW